MTMAIMVRFVNRSIREYNTITIRLQDVDPLPFYATASKSSRLSNIILPLHGCQCVQSSRGVARLALASTPPPLPPILLVHPGWSMWRCTRGQKAGSVSTTRAPRMQDSPGEEPCCEDPCGEEPRASRAPAAPSTISIAGRATRACKRCASCTESGMHPALAFA